MASKAVLFVALNLLFFTVANACGSCPTPTPPPPPPPATPPPPSSGKCPLNALKFGVCADVLGLVKGEVGKVPAEPCCTLIKGLVDLEAAVCLCTAIKANVLGLNLNIPINLSLVLNFCGKGVPTGFKCA